MTCLVPGADGDGQAGTARPEGDPPAFPRLPPGHGPQAIRIRAGSNCKRRIHILEGFRIIFDALDKAIKMIRESEGKQDAAEKLMKDFELDDEQTTAILDSQLYKIAQMEIQKILDELREKKREAKRIQEILNSEAKLWGVIKDEFKALEEKFAEKRRRTRMASDEDRSSSTKKSTSSKRTPTSC